MYEPGAGSNDTASSYSTVIDVGEIETIVPSILVPTKLALSNPPD